MGRPPVVLVGKKMRIVLSVLAGEMMIVEAARWERVSEPSIGRWRADFLEAGGLVWPRGGGGRRGGSGSLRRRLRI